MFGLLNLYKPSGISSREAINRVQRWIRPHKIGHAGTLDPLAEGVLVATLGPATRLTSYIHTWPKSYRGTFLLGRFSDTEDVTGQVVACDDATMPSLDELSRALEQFRGTIWQQPPAYSALKVDGRRAYDLARRGESTTLAARPVTIFELQLRRYEYPELELLVVCSTGTYIRSLGRDIARTVGTQAVMSQLTRTSVGHLTLDTAIRPDQLSRDTLANFLLPAREAVRRLPEVTISEDQWKRLSHGRTIELPESPSPEVAAMAPDGELAALLAPLGRQQYRATRMLRPPA